MPLDITPATLGFLYTQWDADFTRGFGSFAPKWPEFAQRVPSGTAGNTYAWFAQISGFREWIGPRVFKNFSGRAYQVINKDWENSFAVPRNAIQDDQYGFYSQVSQMLGNTAARLWDDLCAEVLQRGTSTIGPDGQFIFDTDHPVDPENAGSGTYVNTFTNRPLTVENLNFLRQTMFEYKGENDRSLQVSGNLLMVPPALEAAGMAATGQTYAMPVTNVAGSENVGAIAMPNPNAGVRLVVNPALANEPMYYYLMSVDRLKPMILQVRQEPVFQQRTDAGYDNVFYRKEYEYGADARGNAAITMPFLIQRVKTTA